KDSLNYFRAANDGFHLCQVYGQLSQNYQFLGQIEKALGWIQRFLKQSREIENKTEESWALWQLARASQALGRMAEAEIYYHSSKRIMATFGNLLGIAVCEGKLSAIAFFAGNMQQARAFAHISTKLAGDVGDPVNMAWAMGVLGLIDCVE